MTKLTLSVDPKVVSRAKQYSKKHGVSISSMVEAYLAEVSARPAPAAMKNAPLSQSLRGSLKRVNLEDYRKHLVAKYL